MEGKDTNVTTKAMTAEELEKKLSKEEDRKSVV